MLDEWSDDIAFHDVAIRYTSMTERVWRLSIVNASNTAGTADAMAPI